jgi:predicted DNA-binding transcriptional regulator AlpA
MSADLLTPEEVSAQLGVSERTLAAWRNHEYGVEGPPWIGVTRSTIRYRAVDIEAWLEERKAVSS